MFNIYSSLNEIDFKKHIYIIKSGVCMSVCLSVCQHFNVLPLTSPPVLKLWDSQGYLLGLAISEDEK